MASFCTKCGAVIPDGSQFCTACGTPISAAPAAPVPAVYPQSVAVPPNSGGSALRIILIIVAVFVGLGLLGAAIFGFTVWRVAHSIHVDGSNGQVTLNTPGGKITANQSITYSASELGTDVYPGAQGGHGSMKMDLPSGSMVTGVFVSSDSKDQVLSFYKEKLGSGASVYDSANTAMVTLNKGQEESVMVTIAANSSQDDGKTRISIVHTKSRKAS